MNLLTIPLALFRQLLRQQQRQRQPLRCPVGLCRWQDNHELLVRAPGTTSARYLLFDVSDDVARPRSLSAGCLGLLTLGSQRRRGQAWGLVQLTSGLHPLDHLRLPGPGMHRLTLSGEGAPAISADRERWSRTIAALGPAVWRRLTQLPYGVAGLGRTGSIVAQSIAAGWGVERLTLIDPDVIEIHNLGEMSGVGAADRGRRKVEVLAEHLGAARGTGPAVAALPASITRRQALAAVQGCDVLFGCLDHDGARWAATILATLFCKPYLDIAAGIHGEGAGRRMGADVRLVLPGERCLLCLGGLADPETARRVLTSADAEQAFYAGRDWRQERAGSLRSLNQLAASVALRLWEDFIGGRVRTCTWTHIEFDPAGRLAVSYPAVTPTAPCRLCALAGSGEEGIGQAAELLRALREPG